MNTGTLFFLTFQIKGGAAAGSYPVTVRLLDNEAANLSNIDAEPVAVSFTADAVQVAGASGHSLTKTEAKAATCTEDGNTAYWTCGTCHKLFSDAD